MPHGENPGFQANEHWVTCDRCGFEYRASEMKKQWDGLVVCPQDYEPRHPQDFVRAVADDIGAKGLVRPQVAGTTRDTNDFSEVGIGTSEDFTVPSGTFDNTL